MRKIKTYRKIFAGLLLCLLLVFTTGFAGNADMILKMNDSFYKSDIFNFIKIE
jgi:hypothetical protein